MYLPQKKTISTTLRLKTKFPFSYNLNQRCNFAFRLNDTSQMKIIRWNIFISDCSKWICLSMQICIYIYIYIRGNSNARVSCTILSNCINFNFLCIRIKSNLSTSNKETMVISLMSRLSLIMGVNFNNH